jgi:hypothetical protein
MFSGIIEALSVLDDSETSSADIVFMGFIAKA